MNTSSLAKSAFAALCTFVVFCASADQVTMRNGDQYLGKTICFTNNSLIFQSDNLGKLTLPKSQVASVSFVPVAPVKAIARTNAVQRTAPVLSAARAPSGLNLPTLPSGTNMAGYNELLSQAGPEAKAKFNEMMSGLMSGKLSVSDIRKEAKATADQVRALRAQLGDDAGASLDGYLSILDSFLNEPETAAPPR